jgi:sulfate adenylyltransferase subunit 1 (EFTu-like GTPase family)
VNHLDQLEAEAVHVIREVVAEIAATRITRENRSTGAFILIYETTNDTVGAGMIADVR